MAMSPQAIKLAKQRRLESGMCSEVGCPFLVLPGKTMCRQHLDKTTGRARNRKGTVAADICPRCKQNPPAPVGKFCQPCIDDVSALQLSRKRKQRGLR